MRLTLIAFASIVTITPKYDGNDMSYGIYYKECKLCIYIF